MTPQETEAAGKALMFRIGQRLARLPELAKYDPITIVTIADATLVALLADIEVSELDALWRR